jgi:hypothetical protein
MALASEVLPTTRFAQDHDGFFVSKLEIHAVHCLHDAFHGFEVEQ